MELEPEESKRFHLLTLLMTVSFTIDLVKTGLSESEIEAEGLTNHRVHFHAL